MKIEFFDKTTGDICRHGGHGYWYLDNLFVMNDKVYEANRDGCEYPSWADFDSFVKERNDLSWRVVN